MNTEELRQALIAALRDVRVKHGTDYAMTVKYGETRIFCHEVWSPLIHEVAESIGYKLHSVQTYR